MVQSRILPLCRLVSAAAFSKIQLTRVSVVVLLKYSALPVAFVLPVGMWGGLHGSLLGPGLPTGSTGSGALREK